jgi:hypothetical protein
MLITAAPTGTLYQQQNRSIMRDSDSLNNGEFIDVYLGRPQRRALKASPIDPKGRRVDSGNTINSVHCHTTVQRDEQKVLSLMMQHHENSKVLIEAKHKDRKRIPTGSHTNPMLQAC